MTVTDQRQRQEETSACHRALVYDTDAGLARSVNGIMQTAGHDDLTFLSLSRRSRNLITDHLLDQSRLIVLPPLDEQHPIAAARDQYTRLSHHTRPAHVTRLISEIPHVPWNPWLRYETALHRLSQIFSFDAFCLYDSRTTPRAVLRDVEMVHPTVGGCAHQSPCLRSGDPGQLLERHGQLHPDRLEALPPALELAQPQSTALDTEIEALCAAAWLAQDDTDALRVSAAAVLDNAYRHGRAPVLARGWVAADRVVIVITDAGPGPHDPLIAALPADPGASLDHASSLHHVYEAVTDVALFRDEASFVVRLTQRQS